MILPVSLALFVLFAPQLSLFAKDDISVTRDKDKTVYTIESSDESMQRQERERAESLEMLRNMPIVIDGTQNRPMPPYRTQPPVPAQPVRPVPAPVPSR